MPIKAVSCQPPTAPANTAPPGGTTTPLRAPPTLQCTRMHPGVGPVRSGAEGGHRKWKQGCRGAGGQGERGVGEVGSDTEPLISILPPVTVHLPVGSWAGP